MIRQGRELLNVACEGFKETMRVWEKKVLPNQILMSMRIHHQFPIRVPG